MIMGKQFFRGGVAVVALCLCFTGFPVAPIAAQPAAAQPLIAAVSPSAADALGQSLVEALNGTADDRKRWIDANISNAARDRKRDVDWASLLETIRDGNTPFAFSGSATDGDRNVSIGLRRATGGSEGKLSLMMAAAEPEKVGHIWSLPFPKPTDRRELPATLSEAEARLRVERHLQDVAARDEFSGVVLVAKNGKLLLQQTIGYADREASALNATHTRFHLGSIDKMFTAVAIGQLIEAGQLTFDTRLVDLLPDYPNRDAAERITIAHLLSHRAGLGMLWDRKGYDGDRPYNAVSDLIPIFAAEPLLFQPGERAAYSNEGFVVLGAVIEKLTGITWYDYVAHNIFARAGMKQTDYPRKEELGPNHAKGYAFPEEDKIGIGPRAASRDAVSYRGNSCGGGYSTAEDMTRFLNALKAGSLLSPALVDRLAGLVPESIGNYGMGFQAEAIGEDVLRGHDGGGPRSGINSYAKMLWKSGYTIAVLGNYDAPFAQTLGRDIALIMERVDESAT